jgi:hypothetical protein
MAVNEEARRRIRDHEKNVYACMVLGGLTKAVKRNDADRVLLNHNVMCIISKITMCSIVFCAIWLPEMFE